MTFKIVSLSLCFIAFSASLTGCTKKVAEEDSSSTATYAASFYANLVSAGMSASDAAFVSGCSECTSSSSVSSNAVAKNLNALGDSDIKTNAKDSVAVAMTAVADNSHFPDAASKKQAIEIISQAQLATLDALSDASDLADNVFEVAGDLASGTEQSGLTGSDLQSALEHQGTGIAKGLIDDVDSSKHTEVISSFSKGAVDGLLNNPNLASAGADLIGALTQGLLSEVGNERGGKLSGEGKGLIIKEILNGVKTQIGDRSDLSDANKDSYVSNVWDKSSAIISETGNSTVGSIIKDALFSSNEELHFVSIYEATSGGPYDATINIVSGTKPIVLVLVSYRSTTWHFTGATNRIAKIIDHSINGDSLDLSGINPEVVTIPKDSTYASFYGIRPAGGFYYDLNDPWTKAFAVKLRQETGFQVTSFQGGYTQNSFTVGDGLNTPTAFPSLSLSRPWLYSFDWRGVKSYQSSGTPRVDVILWLTSVLSSSLSVHVWVENATTSISDIPAFDHTYTINAGSPFLQVVIPFNQSSSITDTRTFKVHVETTDSVLNYQKLIDGSLVGSSGATNTGSSGYNSGSGAPIWML